jgi:hypothetical protein
MVKLLNLISDGVKFETFAVARNVNTTLHCLQEQYNYRMCLNYTALSFHLYNMHMYGTTLYLAELKQYFVHYVYYIFFSFCQSSGSDAELMNVQFC